ncbi:MAG: TldD/PmbA family protein [Desulfurococcales archaeon]|nr:TldD/PmbA family protein [Desulfurococcales archaeon]
MTENLYSIADDLLSNASRIGDEAVVIVERSRWSMLKLARGEASVWQDWDSITAKIYVSKSDGRVLVARLDNVSPANVGRLKNVFDKLKPSPLYTRLPEPTGKSYSSVDRRIADFLENPENYDLNDELELELAGDISGKVEAIVRNKVLVSTSGAALSGANSGFQGYVRIFRDGSSGQWSWTSSKLDFPLARKSVSIARSLAEECSRLPKTTIGSESDMPVLLGPMVAGNLLGEVAHMASGFSVIAGYSFIRKEMLGSEIASKDLTLEDAPLDERFPEYTLFDEEGLSTYDKPIIQNGILKNILNNTRTAKMLGLRSTANAGLEAPAPFQLRISPGPYSVEELMGLEDRMVYVTNNWYTRFQNYADGTFSTVARDAVFLVEKGDPVACLGRIRITGKLSSLIRKIIGIGREVYPLRWWEIELPSLVPHVLVRTGISG